MKFIALLTLLCFSFNSFALFDFFKTKKRPEDLKSYSERMEYIMSDQAFKLFYEQEKRKAEEAQEKLNQEWKKIEADVAASTNFTPEQQAQLKSQRELEQKKIFETKLATMKEEILREFAIDSEGNVVNIKEWEEAKRKKELEAIELRRIRQFQSEEGLPLSDDVNGIRFNTK